MSIDIDDALLREIGRAILDPGSVIPRGANANDKLETQTRWSARAVASIFEQLIASIASTNNNLFKLLKAREHQLHRDRQEGHKLRADRELLLWLLAEARYLAGKDTDLGTVPEVCGCGARSAMYAHDVTNPLCGKYVAPVEPAPLQRGARVRHTLFGLTGTFKEYGPNGEVRVDVATLGLCMWVPGHVVRVPSVDALTKLGMEVS